MRILVVDDSEYVRVPIHDWFVACGVEVHLAENGHAAVEKCTQNAYDVVLMDLDMPGMNGWEATDAIKRMCPTLPVIILTGSHGLAGRGQKSAVAKVLRKPMALPDLEREVRQVLAANG